MAILGTSTSQTGEVGLVPSLVYINTNDTVATVTGTGYLNAAVQNGLSVSSNNMALVQTSDGGPGWYVVSKSGANTSLLPGDSGEVVLPTVANRIAHFTNINGTISSAAANIINAGNISAGLSGTAGTLSSFPGTASKGSFVVAAVANTGDTLTTLSNVAMGQASVVSIPDPGNAVSRLLVAATATPFTSGNLIKSSGTGGLVVDAGFAVKANTTAAYAGGGTSNAYTATGLTSTSIVTAVILASTNAVSICKAVPGTNTLTVTFSADPGAATTVSWIAITPAA